MSLPGYTVEAVILSGSIEFKASINMSLKEES